MIKSFNLLLFNVYLFLSFNICSKTIVYTNPYGGLGDIFSAVKTATFLKENNLNIALYVDLSSDSNKYLQNSDVIKNVKNIAMNKDIIFINSHQEAFEYEPDNFILVTGKSPPAELINDLSMKKAYIIYEYNEKSVLTPEIFSKKYSIECDLWSNNV